MRESYEIGGQPIGIRTVFEGGNSRQRRTDSGSRYNVAVKWRFTQSQFEIFCAWHRYKINDGFDQFYIDLFVRGSLQSILVQFVDGIYSSTLNAGYWDVIGTLETFTPVTITEAELDAIL